MSAIYKPRRKCISTSCCKCRLWKGSENRRRHHLKRLAELRCKCKSCVGQNVSEKRVMKDLSFNFFTCRFSACPCEPMHVLPSCWVDNRRNAHLLFPMLLLLPAPSKHKLMLPLPPIALSCGTIASAISAPIASNNSHNLVRLLDFCSTCLHGKQSATKFPTVATFIYVIYLKTLMNCC